MKISDFSNHFNNLVEATIYNSLPSGLNSENFAIPIQTHSCNVQFITQPGKYENVDGHTVCNSNNQRNFIIK